VENTAFVPELFGEDCVEEEASMEVEVDFNVIASSSQRAGTDVSDVVHPGGQWDTKTGDVANVFAVVEVKDMVPSCVSAVSFNVSGTDVGPRLCSLSYSKVSPDGPWTNVWVFEVPANGEDTFKSTHTYEASREFEGGFDEAFVKVLDARGDETLTYSEFLTRCKAIGLDDGDELETTAVQQELFDVFRNRDVNMDLDEFKSRIAKPPEANWWKLVVHSNWGSPKRIQVLGPLKFYTTRLVTKGKLLWIDQLDRSKAFDPATSGVSHSGMMLRRISRKYDIDLTLIDDLYKRFVEGDPDQSGVLDSQEFAEMILRLSGANDLRDIPPERLKKFFKQADTDCTGEIDFEEFMMWFRRYAAFELNIARPTFTGADLKSRGSLRRR